ncbi:MAG: fibronectin type III domain-containing protein [Vicinamibacterales bacterium]
MLSVVIVVSAVVLIGLWVVRTGQQRAGSRQFDCETPPQPPTGFAVEKLPNLRARMTWQEPVGTESPTSYVLEAGSGAGKNDVATYIISGSATRTERDGVPGTFFLRVYARNACGTSAPSNEVSVTLP